MMTQAQRLDEKMSFDQLFRISDPRRVARSFKVRGPPLDIDSYADAVYYCFNFKANPSTTGLRHRGYVKFLKPKFPKRTPMQKLDCIVDCTCPDYRYKWAWANKQRQAGRVGAQSLNQSLNRAPKITNPTGTPGLCKHILATREYIYGLLSSFSGDEPDTAEKLNKLTKYATKRWLNYNELVAQAKEREAELQRQIAARRLTGKPVPPAGKEKITLEPPLKPKAPATPTKPTVPVQPTRPFLKTGAATPPGKPGPAPAPKGPSAVGQQRNFLKGEQPYTEKKPQPAPPTPTKGKPQANAPTFLRQQLPRRKREESQTQQNENSLLESVVIPNAEFTMTTLTEARKLVQEMEDDMLDTGVDAGGAPPSSPTALEEPPMGDDMGMGGDEGMEPPISDSAIGADTEADTALGLLRQMRDLLTQLVVAVAPAAEGEGAEGEMPGVGGGALPGEEGGEFEMPGEPPADEEIPAESGAAQAEDEGGGGEGKEGGEGGGEGKEEGHEPEGGSEEEEEKKREERPNRRPSAE